LGVQLKSLNQIDINEPMHAGNRQMLIFGVAKWPDGPDMTVTPFFGIFAT
jgi:hypothetical protein